MKKSILSTLILVVLSLTTVHSQTIDEILEKHFKAVGQTNLVAVNSFLIKAKVSQMGMEMPMEMKIKKSGEFISTVEMQGKKIIQAFDGEKGWMIIPMMNPDPVELAGEQLKQAQEQTNMEGELYNYKQKGSTAEFVGKVTLDGKDAFRIKFTTANGNEKDYFIDTQSYLVTKIKAQISAQGQTVNIEQLLSDFKTVEGITLPMKVETKSPMGSSFIIMEEVKFNENFDNNIFKQPVK